MDAVVVDASALTAAAFVEPEQSVVARLLSGRRMHAPRLLHTELANITVKKVRRGDGEPSLILQRFGEACALPVEVTDPPVDAVVALALTTGLSAYDASYLWVALTLGAPLVTLDRELAKAARRLGVRA